MLAGPVALFAALCRLAENRVARVLATIYVEVFRGTSALVQLFWAFFVLPVFGVNLQPVTVGVLVLALNGAAYAAETIRGALLAVPKPQWEAARLLRLGRWSTLFTIVISQALPTMLPPLGNTMIDMLKASALVSLITVSDLTREVNSWATTGALSLTVAYTILLGGYLVLSLPVNGGIRLLERRLRRRGPLVRQR